MSRSKKLPRPRVHIHQGSNTIPLGPFSRQSIGFIKAGHLPCKYLYHFVMHNQMIEYQQRQYIVQPIVESKSTTTALFVCIKESRDTAVNLIQNAKSRYFVGFMA